MPRDLFEEHNIKPETGKDLFSEKGIIHENKSQKMPGGPIINPESGLGRFVKGTYQGLANTGIGLADLIPGVNIPRATFAGTSPAAKGGEIAGEIGSFAVPGFGIERAAKAIPYISKALKSIKPNALTQLAKGAGEGALFGAIQNPEEQLKGAAEGAGLGAAGGALSSLSRLSNPLVRALAGAGTGALAGAGIGSLTPYGSLHGAETGALLGASAPSALSKFSMNRLQPGLEVLENIKPEDVMERFQAGQKLGRTLSPAEASGNPFISSLEAQYGKRGAASRKKTEIGERKYGEEEKSINKLLETVYDKSVASDNKIKDLYTQVYQKDIPIESLNALKDNNIIKAAIKKVNTDPVYSESVKNVPENNYKYLDAIKNRLDDMEGVASRQGANKKAREITKTRNEFLNILDENNPDYKIARQEAQRKIIRSNLEEDLGSKEIRASDFYTTFLKNNNKYNKLLSDLKNVPEAQEQLTNMKKAFKHVINLGTTRGEYANAEKNMKNGRSSIHDLIDRVHEFIGTNRNQAALDYLYSPEWIKGFDQISKLKDKSEKNKRIYDMIGNILSKSVTPSGMGKDNF